MKNIGIYIGLLFLVWSMSACTDEQSFDGQNGSIRVTGVIDQSSRTVYDVGEDAVVVSWDEGDLIGLFPEGQSRAIRYKALTKGKQVDFAPVDTPLEKKEGGEFYAYYPHVESALSFPHLPFRDLFTQSYCEDHPDPAVDFMYAKSQMQNGELHLHFSHLFTFLKLNIRAELLDNAQGLFVRSVDPLIPVTEEGNLPYFDMEKEMVCGVKYNHMWYLIPADKIADKEVVTCYLAVLPTSEDNVITFFLFKNDGTADQAILERKAPEGGFLPGHVYDLTVDEMEFEDVMMVQQREKQALIDLYNATDGDNWINHENWCSDKPLYEWYGVEYWDGRVRSLSLSENGLTGNLPASLANLENLNYMNLTGNRLSGNVPDEILASKWWNEVGFGGILFQQEGYKLIFPTYESTDYSMDGSVVTLQTHTVGDGLKLVIFGDAYSDRLIADGTYRSHAEQAMKAFFSEEPYASFQDYFDVYMVNVVSRNEILGENTAFQTSVEFERNTFVTNPLMVIDYCYKMAETNYQTADVTTIVLLNSSAPFRSNCSMWSDGFSAAFCLYGQGGQDLEYLIHHEACGHGFGKLADEYTEFEGYYPYSAGVEELHAINESMNIDVTSDPLQVSWGYFLSDARYANEKIGIYEGADYYPKGVYRATENSIMRYNSGGFNAPSRQSIYRRIMEKSGGMYNFEEFLKYDEINRQRIDWGVVSRSISMPEMLKGASPIRYNYPASEARSRLGK